MTIEVVSCRGFDSGASSSNRSSPLMMEIHTHQRHNLQASKSFPSLFVDADSLLYKLKTMSAEEDGDGGEDEEDCTEATTQFGDELSLLSGGTLSDRLAEPLSGLDLADGAPQEGGAPAEHRGDALDEEHSGTVSPIPSCESSDDDDDSEVFPPCPLAPQQQQQRQDSSTEPSRAPRRTSLRRSSLSAENLHINPKRGCWKVLPAPDIATIKTSRSLSCLASAETEAPELEPHRRKKRAVSFGEVHMRSYEQTLGDNPSVSYGPPISLDWRFLELPSLSLEQFEATKKAPRKPREMVLNYYNRKHLLSWKFGFSEDELKRATRDADRCKRERAMTRALLAASKLEDMFESARRKAVRRVSSSSSNRFMDK
jgi:hypothetical protein